MEVTAGSHYSGIYEFRPALASDWLAIADLLVETYTDGSFNTGDVLFFHGITPNLASNIPANPCACL